MEFFVKYAYVFIIAIFVIVLCLIYSERLIAKKNDSYNLLMNILIVAIMSIIILSTLLYSFNPNNNSFFLRMFNTMASRNMLMFYGCVLYILYLNNTESFDNNYVHEMAAKVNLGKYIDKPFARKLDLGKYVSNRTVAIVMLFATVFVTAKSLHETTIYRCGLTAPK